MAIIVFVWRPTYFSSTFSVGHTSILINNLYISWFPQKHELRSALKSPVLHHSMKQDVVAEGRIPDFASSPIKNLDEERMGRWAKYILGHGPSGKMEFEKIEYYKLFSTSCAGLVIRALLVGSHIDNEFMRLLTSQVPQPLDCEAIARLLTRDKSPL